METTGCAHCLGLKKHGKSAFSKIIWLMISHISSRFNQTQREGELRALLQGVQVPPPRPVAATPLPAPAPAVVQVVQAVRVSGTPLHHFALPQDTMGCASVLPGTTQRRRTDVCGQKTSAGSVTGNSRARPATSGVNTDLAGTKFTALWRTRTFLTISG